ncbi:hypothetical protein AGMMS49965_09190 [Bacteroidia bacterium]|nr:hypothetical protein AGMMS49965_09190 [Bacteroidia bacterium]
MTAVLLLFCAASCKEDENEPKNEPEDKTVPVTDVTLSSATTTVAGTPLTLAATVEPATATNKTIVWSVKAANGTGATIADSVLTVSTAGNVVVAATIAKGVAAGEDFTKDFTIIVTPALPVVVETPMRYIENDRIKLGIDLNLGGAVTFLSDNDNGGKNMINSFDWGRQIQMSYYSGPWPYIGPNGETPADNWAGLGWNPIQSGDAGGHRSTVTAFEMRGQNAMFVRCIPMQWPHTAGVPGDCEFECLYTLEDNVITMEATIVNNRSDKTQYRACSQEMPAVYTNGPWYNLVTYLGDQPFSGQPVTNIVTRNDGKGCPWVHFYTPENWVALLDGNGKGIGVFQPEVMTFNGGFHPGDALKGFGGAKDGQTGHIAPVGTQILDANIRWTYKTAFILGTLNDIRSYAQKHWQAVTPPEWTFQNSRQNWYYQGDASDTGFPIEDMLDIRFKKNASLVSPVTFWKAADAPVLEIEGAFETASKQITLAIEIQPVGKSDFTDWLNWSEGDQNAETERQQKAIQFPAMPPLILSETIQADGVNRVYSINPATSPDYKNVNKSLKFTFSEDGSAKIKRIKLL